MINKYMCHYKLRAGVFATHKEGNNPMKDIGARAPIKYTLRTLAKILKYDTGLYLFGFRVREYRNQHYS